MLEEMPALVTADHSCFFYQEPAIPKNQLLQTVKLFDGLFMANGFALEESDFIGNNKIGLVVNCQPLELKQRIRQVKCLEYNFVNRRGQVEAMVNTKKIIEIFQEIEECLSEKQEGVILVAKEIESKAATMAGLFLMAKYDWDTERAVAFVLAKKPEIKLNDKYLRLMGNFEKKHSRETMAHIFEHHRVVQDQNLIQNTLMNSVAKNMPNFYGLTHHRHNHPSDHEKRTVKFIQKIEFIDNKNSAFDLSIDLDATPYLDDDISIVPVRPAKLSAVETKLRKFIKDKCHGEMESSLSLKSQARDSAKGECMAIKSKEIIRRLPRRRAASKTEESVESCDDFRIKVKTNNFTAFNGEYSRNSNSSSLAVKHEARQAAYLDEFSTELKLKERIYANPYHTKQHISKRCHTENTNHHDHSIIDNAKLNNLFKISKSNKTSHKKLKAEPSRIKTHSFMGASKQTDIKNGRLEEMIGERLKGRPIVNVNMNVRIDNLNVYQQGREEVGQSGRRSSYKITERRRKKQREHLN